MGKSDTIQTCGRIENKRVAASAAHFGSSSSSNSASTKHIVIIDGEKNHSTAAAAASMASSPMMMLDSSSAGNLITQQTSTTVSGSKRPPLKGVVTKSPTTTATTTPTISEKLATTDKLATTCIDSSNCHALVASPRYRSLRSYSTVSASIVTDEECPQRNNNVTHQSTLESGSTAADSTAIDKMIPHDRLEQHVPTAARRGGRCAVFFAKGKDVFGKSRPGAGGWYPATILMVTQHRNSRHSSKLHVRFDDGTLSNYNYPSSSNEVQLLSLTNPNNEPPPSDNDNINQQGTAAAATPNDHNCMYGESGQVIYHRPTKGVQAGDLVFCFFQQGQGFTSDHWYRGRVVATRRLEDFPVCDICYDDGDFECNVPFTTGVVLKHADGWDQPEWMVGLEVQIPPKKRTFHVTTGAPVKSGIVKEAKPHGAVWIEYDNGNMSNEGSGGGGTFTEKRAYLMVAQRLMLHAKEHLMDPKRSFQWPYISDTAVIPTTADGRHHEDNSNSLLIANMIHESNKSSLQLSKQQPSPKNNNNKLQQQRVAKKIQKQQELIEIVDVEQETNKAAASTELSPKKKMRTTRKTPSTNMTTAPPQSSSAAVTAKESTTSAAADPKPVTKPPTGRKRAAPRQASTTAAQRRAQTELNNNVECVAESDWSDSEAEEGDSSQQLPAAAASSTRPMKDIQASLGSSLATSVNSSDPHLGAETLMFMAVHHKQMPGQRVRQSLLALMTHGPSSGKTLFDDCHRMTLAEQYVSHCLTRPGTADNFALDACPSYWSDCLTNLTALYYCCNGDEDRTSGFAIDRIAQTVFAKTCCANLFLTLITSQLQAFIGKKCKHEINREQLLTLPIVKDIAGHRRGAKEAFETSAKAYAELCITLGHFDQGHVAGLLLEEDDVVGPSDQSIRFVCMHSRRLLEKAGQITSMLAWLYGYVANEDTQSVGRLLRSIFQRAFNDKQFDPTPFLGDEQSVDKHWSLVKLRLILNLDKRAIPGVRPMLAETLGVGMQYNAIFG